MEQVKKQIQEASGVARPFRLELPTNPPDPHMLESSPKGDARKVELAKLLRCHTPVARQRMARRLRIGSASYVSHLVKQSPTIVDCENCPFFFFENQRRLRTQFPLFNGGGNFTRLDAGGEPGIVSPTH